MSFSEYWTRKTVTQRFGFIIAAAVSLFWLWFGIASGLGESEGIAGLLMHVLLPGMLLILPVVLAFRWEYVGGALLIAAGIFTVFFFHTYNNMFLLSLLTAPPMVAGFLLFPYKVKTS